MRRFTLIFTLILILALALVACGGDDSDDSEPAADSGSGGSVSNGEELYKQTVIGSASAPGCITCHSLEEGVTLVGPSHKGIATRAEAEEGSVEDYLRTSITDPDDVITEGFTEGVMYRNYGTDLTASQIDDLVAFLLTLE